MHPSNPSITYRRFGAADGRAVGADWEQQPAPNGAQLR